MVARPFHCDESRSEVLSGRRTARAVFGVKFARCVGQSRDARRDQNRHIVGSSHSPVSGDRGVLKAGPVASSSA